MLKILHLAGWIIFLVGAALNPTSYYHIGLMLCVAGAVLVSIHMLFTVFQKGVSVFTKIRLLSFSILLWGLTLSLGVFPLAALFMFLSCIIYLIVNIVFFAKNIRKDVPTSLFYLTCGIWFAFFVFNFFTYSAPWFVIGITLSVVFIFSNIKNKAERYRKIVLSGCIIVFSALFAMPSYRIYYYMNAPVISYSSKPEIKSETFGYYSWHLFTGGKYAEALSAVDTALNALNGNEPAYVKQELEYQRNYILQYYENADQQ